MNSRKGVDLAVGLPIEMSVQSTRPQYAFIQTEGYCVSLLGPRLVVSDIYSSCPNSTRPKSIASTATLSLSRSNGDSIDLMFLKATLLEEVLKYGFEPISNVTDNPVVLCRRVDLMQ